ncbi:kinase-like protein [Lactarius hengduanensis]|nr:kinase-like protein [Lactarius hengduanensis]
MSSEQPPSNAPDIFSLSDRVLAEKLQFVKEIGFGNWGSVWLCRPRVPDSADDTKLAVKLVHRSKTTTTAARVRSLWNEMKVVRTFKNDPHPSIVPFHSFIITPSYALITMEYLPELVPVEVPEHRAKEWFRSLLSGVQFLHSRGVVHNDIKPANILLSERQVPVLVDFGFAEKYDWEGTKAFSSNLTYGTPEYLSPERARGLAHDTRKADIWSLGVTFFEILVGRTPFEHTEGEQFATKAALEDYWARTMRGKWLGSWKMSKGIEKMLHRMIQPNADVRCTAPDALGDSYWIVPLPVPKNATSSGTPDNTRPRNDAPVLSSRQVSKGKPPKRERVEKRDEDKENAPVTTPNSKKNPVRQRVLSGSGGKFPFFGRVGESLQYSSSPRLSEETP